MTQPGGTIIRPGQWRGAVAALAAGQRITYVGASGPIEFDANGDVPGNVAQFTIQGGTFVRGRSCRRTEGRATQWQRRAR